MKNELEKLADELAPIGCIVGWERQAWSRRLRALAESAPAPAAHGGEAVECANCECLRDTAIERCPECEVIASNWRTDLPIMDQSDNRLRPLFSSKKVIVSLKNGEVSTDRCMRFANGEPFWFVFGSNVLAWQPMPSHIKASPEPPTAAVPTVNVCCFGARPCPEHAKLAAQEGVAEAWCRAFERDIQGSWHGHYLAGRLAEAVALIRRLAQPVGEVDEASRDAIVEVVWRYADDDAIDPDTLVDELCEALNAARLPAGAVNAAMAAEYRRWIDFFHSGEGDYNDFLRRELPDDALTNPATNDQVKP